MSYDLYTSFQHVKSIYVSSPPVSTEIKENVLTAYVKLDQISSSSDDTLKSSIKKIQDLIRFSNETCKYILKRFETYQYPTIPSYTDYLAQTNQKSTEAIRDNYDSECLRAERSKYQTMEEIYQFRQLGPIFEVFNQKINQVVNRLLAIDPQANVETVKEDVFKNIPDNLKLFWECPSLMKKSWDAPKPLKSEETTIPSTSSTESKQIESTTPTYWITTDFDVKPGNTLFIRGSSAGLSWGKGIEMTYLNNKWCYPAVLPQGETVEFKFCINDSRWEAGEQNHSLTIGKTPLLDEREVTISTESTTNQHQLEVTARF